MSQSRDDVARGVSRSGLETHRPPQPSVPNDLRWALRALCLTEIISWGVPYYAFPVLGGAISRAEGWSHTAITAAFSLALLVAAAAGIPAGRIIQDHGPRWLMTAGSVLGSCAIVLVAAAPNLPIFVLGWALAGIAMAGVLYAPAFAAVTVWFDAQRIRALTAITLVAGLASTVFAPVTALLADHLSWRGTYLVLALFLAFSTAPAHYFALRPRWPRPRRSTPTTAPSSPATRDTVVVPGCERAKRLAMETPHRAVFRCRPCW